MITYTPMKINIDSHTPIGENNHNNNKKIYIKSEVLSHTLKQTKNAQIGEFRDNIPGLASESVATSVPGTGV